MMTAGDDMDELFLDGGPLVRRGEAERTCIVNRRAVSPDRRVSSG